MYNELMMYTAEDIQRIDDSNNVKEFSKIYLRRIWGIRKPGILYTCNMQEMKSWANEKFGRKIEKETYE